LFCLERETVCFELRKRSRNSARQFARYSVLFEKGWRKFQSGSRAGRIKRVALPFSNATRVSFVIGFGERANVTARWSFSSRWFLGTRIASLFMAQERRDSQPTCIEPSFHAERSRST